MLITKKEGKSKVLSRGFRLFDSVAEQTEGIIMLRYLGFK